MIHSQADYIVLSQRAHAAAATELLANVREKHLKSAATWEALAHSARQMDELRMKRLAEGCPSAAYPDLPSHEART